MKNIAVILAGGIGKRVGSSVPKQLLPLKDGRNALELCLDVFSSCSCIDAVLVVMHPDWISSVPACVEVIPGGEERWMSSWNAVRYVYDKYGECNILLHDCARPFVDDRIVSDVCLALKNHEAVTVAVPAVDTVYVVNKDSDNDIFVSDIPPRSYMMRAQTPQAFRITTIRDAYKMAMEDGMPSATDDCGVVLKYLPNMHICVVAGEERNRKLTFKEDFLTNS